MSLTLAFGAHSLLFSNMLQVAACCRNVQLPHLGQMKSIFGIMKGFACTDTQAQLVLIRNVRRDRNVQCNA